MSFIYRATSILKEAKTSLMNAFYFLKNSNNNVPALVLALDVNPDIQQKDPTSQATAQTLLDSVLKDGFLWAVPKSRRSHERIMTRKFGRDKIRKFMTPKATIVACLECGHWHEKRSICGNCYEKVREETKAMREAMPYDDYHYNVPRTEVAYRYQGEEDDQLLQQDKYIVKMNKKRPNWWPRNLLTKGHS